jgi:hypothetical protein
MDLPDMMAGNETRRSKTKRRREGRKERNLLKLYTHRNQVNVSCSSIVVRDSIVHRNDTNGSTIAILPPK